MKCYLSLVFWACDLMVRYGTFNPRMRVRSPPGLPIWMYSAAVEHAVDNRKVPGSNPGTSTNLFLWSCRLMVRTPPFQGGNRSSILRGTAKFLSPYSNYKTLIWLMKFLGLVFCLYVPSGEGLGLQILSFRFNSW